jgi:hypothetical protein
MLGCQQNFDIRFCEIGNFSEIKPEFRKIFILKFCGIFDCWDANKILISDFVKYEIFAKSNPNFAKF